MRQSKNYKKKINFNKGCENFEGNNFKTFKFGENVQEMFD